ncbi:MAG: bifunctional folylpolyglutamate synthase/dihydrofolate synthase [Pyrinomonadaceae bacterium]|nr:bifunctional folylpolyglutamate synthase/dihydrofolate synthase [Pyrinomonadaceae bacterium]
MNFPETIEYLLSLGHETVAIKLGLRNTQVLLEALGNPHTSFQSVQIAGTNGKGSTAVMLESICRSADIAPGLYTSPHLISITERIRINGANISENDFAKHATRVRAAAESLLDLRTLETLPTFFEQVTAIALVAFREAGVNLAILETGLGGRLDATTVAGANTVAITPVSLDHQEYLGETLAEIASEKAAIIRPGVTAVIARQPAEALAVILRRCAEVSVEPDLERQASIEATTDDGHFKVTFESREVSYDNVLLGLRGRHQITNAMVAIQLAESLRKQGFEIPKDAVVAGIEQAQHAGRLELFQGQPSVLLDGAHNPSGAQALRDYLAEFAKAPITLVFGAMNDKRLEEIAEVLFPLADLLILTQPDNPRAARVDELVELAARFVSPDKIVSSNSVPEAVALAKSLTQPDGTVCVTGSLYLVGETMAIMNAVISGSPQRLQRNTEDERRNKQPAI